MTEHIEEEFWAEALEESWDHLPIVKCDSEACKYARANSFANGAEWCAAGFAVCEFLKDLSELLKPLPMESYEDIKFGLPCGNCGIRYEAHCKKGSNRICAKHGEVHCCLNFNIELRGWRLK